MNYQQATGKTIDESFEEFHLKNPVIYALFQKYALYMIREKGMSKTSSKLIINRIRWEMYVETESEDTYRINDAYSSRYVRLFIKDYPEYDDKFELRELRSIYRKQYIPGQQLIMA